MEITTLFDLSGKNALVTGGSQGIGKAIALGLAEFGANVIIHYHSNHVKADAALDEMSQFKVKSGKVAADLGEAECIPRIRESCLSQLGRINILVLNASIQIRKRWDQMEREETDRQWIVNVRSNLQLMQTFIPAMRENRWGRIITVGSVQQKRPHPEMIVYSATKSALENMVISLAPELARDQVTINNLAPGAIATMRNEKVLSDPGYLKKVLSKIPAGRIGEAVDCAGIAVLLASDAGSYITGQTIYIDGGMGIPD